MKQVQIVNSKKFVIAALSANSKIFVIHVAIQKQEKMLIHFKKQAQIKAQNEAQIGVLLFDKVFTEVLVKYSNYSNIFLVENIAKLPENTRINEHATELKKGKKLLFGLIYSLELVELETLKTFNKTNLINGFIRPFKSPIEALILFNKKLNRNFHFCMNYWGFNNITIKN